MEAKLDIAAVVHCNTGKALVCIRGFFVVVEVVLRGCSPKIEVDYWSLLGSSPAFLWLARMPCSAWLS